MDRVHLESVGIPIVVPMVKTHSPYRLTNMTWTQLPMRESPGQPLDTDIWMKHIGNSFEWVRPTLYYVYINGERYFYDDEPTDARVTRDRLIGLVVPKP
jgi:hypothetical protein